MKKIYIASILFSLFFLAECKGSKKQQEPLEETTIQKVCTPAFGPFYDAKKYVRYHRVAFNGILQAPKSVFITNTMHLDIHEKPNRGGVRVRASFKIGTGDNQVLKLKDRFSEADLKVKSNSGAMLANGSKVRIVGEVSPGGIPDKWLDGCYVKVESVEAAQ